MFVAARPRCGTRRAPGAAFAERVGRGRGDGVCTITLASSESKFGARAVAGVAERVGARTRCRTAARTRSARRPPGWAVPSAAIVSMFTRAWMATPRGAGTDACAQPDARRACGRAASSSWARTRSTPVTSSVTVCSTWRRRVGLDERRGVAARSASTRNSNVPRLRVADVGRHPHARRRAAPRACRRRAPAPGRSRQLLVAALDAALALPQVGDRRRCRRRRSAPRCGAPGSTQLLDEQRRRCRTRTWPPSGTRSNGLGTSARRRRPALPAAAAAGDRLERSSPARPTATSGTRSASPAT